MPREREVTGKAGHGVSHQGPGLGGGPSGPGSYSGRPGTGSSGPVNNGEKGVVGGSSGGLLAAGLLALLLGKKGGSGNGGNGGGGLNLGRIIRIAIIVIIVLALLKACSGGGSTVQEYTAPAPVQTAAPVYSGYSYGTPYGLSNINAGVAAVPATTPNLPAASAGSTSAAASSGLGINYAAQVNTDYSAVNTATASNIRAKYYKPQANETVNVMIYMIGTDLESSYGMGTNDLKEIISGISGKPDNVNFFVYGGGCRGWKNNVFSNSSNICYAIGANGGFTKLYEDGNKVMTEPDTLGEFIRTIRKNYPANRNILILWDHGGGSVTGYGYDERHRNAGSMDLAGISQALKTGGVQFDIVGFDACLMATAETGLMLNPYADYMIASEESEPGIGWYYTNWVKMLCSDPKISSLELGKRIVDDFVTVCAQQCRGQDTTLSVTDVAELNATLPKALAEFSNNTTDIIQNSGYRTVATARSSAKEFAADSRIDQVDLTDIACKMGNAGTSLAKAVTDAVKYNRTSNTVRNAYGLSIYFPYRSLSTVSKAVKTYNNIGISQEYSKFIQSFASMSSGGQQSSAGYSFSPYDLLTGGSYPSSGSSSVSSDDIYSLLSSLMGSYAGYSGRSINLNDAAEYIAENQFDPGQLVWTEDEEGNYVISLPEDQWKLVTEVRQSLFMDDGAGYVDLGLDLTSDCLTTDGKIIGTFGGAWLGINNDWTCAYYLESEVIDENGDDIITGRIPALYNGQRGYLIAQFVNNKGGIIGFMYNYIDEDSNVSSKFVPADGQSFAADDFVSEDYVLGFRPDDEIVLIADYYDYDGNYDDTYAISNTIKVGDGLTVSDLELQDPSSANACYRIVDMYNQSYWTPLMQ